MPALEHLPLELLIEIFTHLKDPGIVVCRLIQCNRLLHERLESLIWTRPEVRRRGMHWGCIAGRCEPIRLAASYGAPVSFLEPLDASRHLDFEGKIDTTKVRPGTSTLNLAASRGHVDALQCLLDLGARIHPLPLLDRYWHMKQLASLAKHLCTPNRPELVRIFFNACLDVQIKESGLQSPHVYQPLVKLIESRQSCELLSLCLHHGANVNAFQLSTLSGYRDEGLTPLSTAVIVNSPETFRLLVTRGASIQGVNLSKRSRRALHIPVCAAAYAMATSQPNCDMMKLCLENGADINQQVLVTFPDYKPWASKFWSKYYLVEYLVSPVIIYIGFVAVWTSDVLNPVKGLRYLIENGATVQWGQDSENAPRDTKADLRSREKRVSALEMIFKCRGVEMLTFEPCLSAAEILIEHGAIIGDAGYLLTAYATQMRVAPSWWYKHLVDSPDKRDGQRILMKLVIEDLKRRNALAEANNALWQYITHLGTVSNDLEQLGTDIIDGLISIGANINEPAWYYDTPLPALHWLCYKLNTERLERYEVRPYRHPSQWFHLPPLQAPFRFLLSRGADPYFHAKGGTAVDLLLYRLDRFESKVQEYLRGMATLLERGGVDDTFVA